MDSRGVAGFNLRDFSTDVSEAYEAYEVNASVEKPRVRVRKNIFKEIARGVGYMPVMKSVREGFYNADSVKPPTPSASGITLTVHDPTTVKMYIPNPDSHFIYTATSNPGGITALNGQGGHRDDEIFISGLTTGTEYTYTITVVAKGSDGNPIAGAIPSDPSPSIKLSDIAAGKVGGPAPSATINTVHSRCDMVRIDVSNADDSRTYTATTGSKSGSSKQPGHRAEEIFVTGLRNNVSHNFTITSVPSPGPGVIANPVPSAAFNISYTIPALGEPPRQSASLFDRALQDAISGYNACSQAIAAADPAVQAAQAQAAAAKAEADAARISPPTNVTAEIFPTADTFMIRWPGKTINPSDSDKFREYTINSIPEGYTAKSPHYIGVDGAHMFQNGGRLVYGTSYRFTVTVSDGTNHTGSPSSPSNSVTLEAPPVATPVAATPPVTATPVTAAPVTAAPVTAAPVTALATTVASPVAAAPLTSSTQASAQAQTPGPIGNQCRKTTDVHYTKAEGVAAQIMNAYNELCNGGQSFSCKQVLTGSLYCPNFPGDFPVITSVTQSSISWGITNPGLGYPPYYEIYIYKGNSKVKTYTLGQNNNQPVNQRTFSSVQTSDFNYLSGETYTIIVSAFYNTLSGTYDSAPFTYVVPSTSSLPPSSRRRTGLARS